MTKSFEVCCTRKGLFDLGPRPMYPNEKMDWWTRCRFHPCIKGHVGQCRGQVGRVPLNAKHGVCWWHQTAKWQKPLAAQRARYPHQCSGTTP